MIKEETSLSAKLNTVTKENAELKKELAQLKNAYKDSLTSEEENEMARIYLYYAYVIFTNSKAMKKARIFAKLWKDVCNWETLAHDIVVAYTKYDIYRAESKYTRCKNDLDYLIRDIYNIINPQKKKGGETKNTSNNRKTRSQN